MRKFILCGAAVISLLVITACSGGNQPQSSTTVDAPVTSASSTASETASKPEEQQPIVRETAEAAPTLEVKTPTAEAPAETAEVPEKAETAEAEDTMALLMSQYDNEYLGLPQKDKNYIFKSTGIKQQIDGAEFHGVSCHDMYEGQLYYMCDFYISADGAAVYRFYESTGEFVLLPETVYFPDIDPSTQGAEEIFFNASSLYNAALGIGLTVDPADTTELDGVKYYRVADERFTSLIDVVTKLNSYFTQDIINSLMELQKLREINGALYAAEAQPSGSGADVQYELFVLDDSSAEYIAYITAPAAEGETAEVTEYTYILEQQFGIWRFTNFRTF